MIGGAETVFAQQPAGTDERAAQDIDRRIESDRLPAGDLEIKFQMILQILAHASQMPDHGDALLAKFCLGTHTRELQQLRRVDGTAAYDQFAAHPHAALCAIVFIFERHGTFALEGDSRRQCVRHHFQI